LANYRTLINSLLDRVSALELHTNKAYM
jgi:hypothetical protein